jgi:two-component system sensor histidine kinase VicK
MREPIPIVTAEAQLKNMAELAPLLIWISDKEKLNSFFNTAWLSFTGQRLEEAYGNGWLDSLHPDDLQGYLNTYSQAFNARTDFKIQYRLRRSDGVYASVLEHAVSRFDVDGSFAGYVGYGMEIGKIEGQPEQVHFAYLTNESRMQALNEELSTINEEMQAANEELYASNEQLLQSQEKLEEMIDQLAASEHKTRSIIEKAPFPIGVYVGREMRITFANQSILDVWGKGNDVIGKLYTEILPELDNQEIFSQLDHVFTTGESFHARNQRVDIVVDGLLQPFYFNYSFTALSDQTGKIYGVMNTAANITDLITAKSVIEENEERFRTMAEHTDVMIAMADENGDATYFNSAWESLTGMSMEQLLNRRWIDLIHPDDREGWIEVYTNAIKDHASFSGEFRILNKDGLYSWLYARIPARFASDGRFIGYISSCLDITELKQDEIRKNDFIGMVSHELKTPLTSLSGLIQIANRKLRDSDDALLKNAMEKSAVQLKKMGNMINGFLNMSRLESGKIMIDKHTFHLDDLLREIIADTEMAVSSHRFDFAECGDVEVTADRDKIGSVINNLLSNAVKYSPESTVIEIKCEIKGNTAVVSVKDFGIGMKQEDSLKIFDRYHRVETNTTRNISGFGIGLYLSAEIVGRHQGKIWVESEMGSGSTFYFSLPL